MRNAVINITTGSQALDELLGVTSNGINPGDAEKLQDANGLMNHTEMCLTGIKGLCETKVDKMCEATIKIPSGTQSLEALLGGAIETLQFTEAFGEFSLPTNLERGKLSIRSYSYFIVPQHLSFRPDRIEPIPERFGMVARALVDNHQYDLLLGLASKMSEEPVRLPIMDSIMGLLRVDFTGRGELAERQQKLDQMFSRLAKLDQEASFDAIGKVTSYVVNAGDVKMLQELDWDQRTLLS
ncbi:Meiotic recombination protein dmc1 [Orobanche hederae]